MGLLPLRQPGIPRPPPPFSRRRNPHLTAPASYLWPAEDYARRSGERVVVQRLRFCTPSERTQVQCLIREPCRSTQLKRTHICNEDQRPCMLQQRPGANKKINILKMFFSLLIFVKSNHLLIKEKEAWADREIRGKRSTVTRERDGKDEKRKLEKNIMERPFFKSQLVIESIPKFQIFSNKRSPDVEGAAISQMEERPNATDFKDLVSRCRAGETRSALIIPE
ncbi:hypothetical protein MJG53_005183 [Ovis ammon polii x Ovis aries]|uniref:Uncharacterized protein n=1 Tax=Ovis ammon polii x Ovis aries TaxID=2918886 RepID=A0ACB9VCD9_9CETA|nr:hypothetical protein MJG53_005183 [Ovis ammon polii x Ovis aries]